MSTYPDGRALPGAAFALLAIAVGLLWLGFLFLLLAIIWSVLSTGGLGLNPLGALGHLDGPMRFAIGFQWLVYGVGLVVTWLLGSAVVLTHSQGATERAADLAIWLIRVLMVLSVMHVLAAGLVGYSGAQSFVVAATTALPSVPTALVSIAFLVCAEAFLRRPPSDVFE